MAAELRFRMNLSASEAERYYRGTARFVVVKAESGQKIQFPVEHIRGFIDQQGVSGYFSIKFDDNHKFLALNKLSE